MKLSKVRKAKPAKKNKKKYRVRNWHEYDASLRQRGSLEIWIDPDIQKKWYAKPTGKRGRQPIYSDFAIQECLKIGKVFRQKLRQTEGLLQSVFKLLKLTLVTPDHTTFSRRGDGIVVKLPRDTKEKVMAIWDSTGLKVYGEGEWKVRKHGWSKHRTWMKLHIGIDADGEIRMALLTTNRKTDAEVVSELLEQETAEIDGSAGDGAYDKRKVYEVCQKKGVKKFLIPPQKNAKIWQHGNSSDPPHPRDANLRQIRQTSRKQWKQESGYHVRSLAETTMFRYKTTFGGSMEARKFERQSTEVLIKCSILNTMRKLGRPESYAVT